MTTLPEGMVTANEVADIFGIQPQSLSAWRIRVRRSEDVGPPSVRLSHRQVAYSAAEVNDWIKRGQTGLLVSYPEAAASILCQGRRAVAKTMHPDITKDTDRLCLFNRSYDELQVYFGLAPVRDSSDWITPHDAAAVLGISLRSLNNLRSKQRLQGLAGPPFYQLGKRRVVYRRSEVAMWRVARQRRSAASEPDVAAQLVVFGIAALFHNLGGFNRKDIKVTGQEMLARI